ncbi:PE-PPE domain-containing protein [Mycobacterium sp. M26]|uniref:PE-PPE domain-containing protein n=1 Tax=Mycobacterium sp. M26 TaxID=1762962 RepID=UPI000A49CAD6|nr:PE-PPE domain-containing protein [Mycobacterium sp. M26]
MRAANVVGRVGGLAVALGIGAAALSSAVAWADSPSSDSASSSTTHGGSARSAAGTAHGSTTTNRGPVAATPASARSAKLAPVPLTVSARVSTAETASTSETTPEATPATDPVTPSAPADSQLGFALVDFSRRTVATTARATVPAAAAVDTGLVMGPSGVPIPSDEYIQSVFDLYIKPNSPGTIPIGLFTPEGLYPITGVKSLPLNTSVDQGITILKDAIQRQLDAGNTLTVFGYSQSAIISSLVMSQLPADTPINFVLVGNEMNPDGGLLSRFPGLTLPSLGLDFYGATPEDDFPTTNYTLEYDGFADFPKYPLNVLSVLNAGLGIIFVHTQYAKLTQDQVDTAIALPTTSADQKYYIIPTKNLPLLEPVRLIPLIGNPLADLVQPVLRVIVNLGYGDPKYGWSNTGYANVETPFEFLPNVDLGEVVQLLAAGVVQGVSDFVNDFAPGGSFWQELGSIHLPTPGPISLPTTPDGIITAIQDITTTVAATISNAAASIYAALLPTADIVNAIVTMLPAYAVTLFLDGITQAINGDPIAGLINAVGRPLSATVGLVTTAGLIEALVILQAIQGVFSLPVTTSG